jgi:hypothetical protein
VKTATSQRRCGDPDGWRCHPANALETYLQRFRNEIRVNGRNLLRRLANVK